MPQDKFREAGITDPFVRVAAEDVETYVRFASGLVDHFTELQGGDTAMVIASLAQTIAAQYAARLAAATLKKGSD